MGWYPAVRRIDAIDRKLKIRFLQSLKSLSISKYFCGALCICYPTQDIGYGFKSPENLSQSSLFFIARAISEKIFAWLTRIALAFQLCDLLRHLPNERASVFMQ